jgi:hypothetical protein
MDCGEMVNFIRPDLPDESGNLLKIIDIDSPFILPGFIIGDDPGSSYTEDLVFLFVEKPVEKGPVLPGCPYNNCSWHFLSSFSYSMPDVINQSQILPLSHWWRALLHVLIPRQDITYRQDVKVKKQMQHIIISVSR